MSGVRVHEMREAEYDAWSRLVAESPSGSPYAQPEYLDALCTVAGGNFLLLGAWRGDELVGGLPLYVRRSTAGWFVAPRLLLYYVSPVIRAGGSKYPSERTARQIELLGALADAIAARRYAHVELRCRDAITDVRAFMQRGWRAEPGYSYLVPLHDLSAAWARVEQNLRRLIRRAEQAGVTFGEDDNEVTAFYELHRRTLERRDMAAYLPHPAFQTWYARLRSQGLCRLYAARLADGTPAAFQLVLTGVHPVSHTVAAAADPAFLNLGVNAFLRWRSLEALAAQGYQGNDLTDAALNSVTHFKSQLGGDLVTCMVLRAPSSLRWRVMTGLERRYRGLRNRVAEAMHRALEGRE
jgi:hypothetical protein